MGVALRRTTPPKPNTIKKNTTKRIKGVKTSKIRVKEQTKRAKKVQILMEGKNSKTMRENITRRRK